MHTQNFAGSFEGPWGHSTSTSLSLLSLSLFFFICLLDWGSKKEFVVNSNLIPRIWKQLVLVTFQAAPG